MAPVPTPPANVPDLSEEEAAQTPNGYPSYYEKIEAEEAVLREAIESKASETVDEDEPEATDEKSDETPSYDLS